MSYPKRLARLAPKRGILRDLPDYDVPLDYFTDGMNVDFSEGFAQSVLGMRSVYGPLSAPPLGLAYTRLGGIGHWIYVSEDEQHVADGSSHHDISNASLQPVARAHFHQLFLLNGLPIHNNSFDPPMYWNGNTGNPFDVLPDWPVGTVARFMCAHRNFIFALDLTTPSGARHNTVMWSDAAEPGSVPDTWTPGDDNLAGSVDLADSDAPLICAETMNDALMIYKRSAVYSAHFVEDPSVVFAFRPVTTSFGALSRRAVASVPGGHAVVTDGDVVLFDGTTPQSIVRGRYRNAIFDSLDPENYEDLLLFYHRAKQQAWLLVPELGGGMRAFVYDLLTKAWSEREVPYVSAVAAGVVDDGQASDIIDDADIIIDDAVRVFDTSALSLARESMVLAVPNAQEPALLEVDGEPSNLVRRVRRGGLTFGDPARIKFVRRVHVQMRPGSDAVSLRVGGRMNPGDSVVWGNTVAVNNSQVVNVSVVGRYIDVEVFSNGVSSWGFVGAEIEAELRGYF